MSELRTTLSMGSRLVWLIKMAWRDSRRNRSRLFLFTSSIILGIASLVAINSFGENLRNDVAKQAKTLLGADLKLEIRNTISDSTQQLIDEWPGEQSKEVNFSSMVLFPNTGGTRLVQIKALTGNYPFYGKISTNPPTAASSFKTQRGALVDKSVLAQFEAKIGDSIKVGSVLLPIVGELVSVPGRASFVSSMAPVVYIPGDMMDKTRLVQKGSRVQTNYFYKFADNENPNDLIKPYAKQLKKEKVRYDTVESRQESTSKAFGNMNSFLNLVGFIALLLGCIGVASAVHIYIKGKIETVAILRCLGVQGKEAFLIYLIQILAMGAIGSLLGAFLGSLIQTTFPAVLGDFLPFEVNMEISWSSIVQGVGIGLSISLLFALLPLLSVRKVSPLNTLRNTDDNPQAFDPLRQLVFVLIALFVVGFAYWQIRSWLQAVAFTLFIGFAFLMLAGMAKILMWSVRKFFPSSWSYMWRQGLANLYRPNNQTLILLVSIGLGTMLISFLFFTQNMLLSQLTMVDRDNQPNMVLFDIQAAQKKEIADITKTYNLPVIQEVPIVTMRLEAINGRSRKEIEADSTINLPRWAFNRENRVTYRDSLIDSETLNAGKWIGSVDESEEIIPISLEESYAKALGVKQGDELVYNVQGAMMTTTVASLRAVAWNRIQTNFLIVFPSGVLEQAPQFYVMVTRSDETTDLAAYKESVVSSFPNVSVIDLTLILKTIDDIFNKVSFVITFMALFSIITGIMVLIGSVIISKFQRVKESVLLRTLGAQRNQILTITALEYAFLGTLASLTGILLALIGSFAASYFMFKVPFVPPLLPMVTIFLVITGLTVFIGLSNVRGILKQTPLAVLRGE